MPAAARHDPYAGFNFVVEIAGIGAAGFSGVEGLNAWLEVIEYRSGETVGGVRKLPGLRRYANIVLKRGLTQDRQLWDWFRQGVEGSVQRKSCSIVLRDATGQGVLRWNVVQAWPCRWEASALGGTGNDVVLETVELAHEGFELVGP